LGAGWCSAATCAALLGPLYPKVSSLFKFCRVAINSASLDEVEDETQGSLKINIDTAGVDELDALPHRGRRH
jgi:hypothetical protein